MPHAMILSTAASPLREDDAPREALSSVVDVVPQPLARAVRFADADVRARLGGAGMLVLRIEKLGRTERGRLSDVIDDAMERELAARGATSPGIGSSVDPDAALSDQLFRARQVGVYRVCIALGPMSAIASQAGALQPEDAATILFLARATNERPLELVLDVSDEHAGVFLEPVPLKDALEGRRAAPPPKVAELELEKPVEAELEKPEPAIIPVVPKVDLDEARLEAQTVHAAMERHTVGTPVASMDDAHWRHWTLALHAAKGPQPLATFERLFTQSYVPLADAVDQGLSDPRAVQAREEFRSAFSRMYAEACPSFAATGKRPKMVFDAPDIAARLGRAQRARKVQLLLVSSMRYDIGVRLHDAFAARSGVGVSVVASMLLWSALPTTTSRQLDCLTRGVEALRGSPSSERDLEAVRGRTALAIRRVKIGSRDVMKLDACEAKIREASGLASELPALTGTLERAVTKHLETLDAGTLLFVFGDHGFTLDGSGAAREGGATPEEVLVPAFALLVGERA
jgi:hypothetical protein